MVSGVARSTPSGTAISGGTTVVRVRWVGSDATSGIARYQVERQVDGGAWTRLPAEPATPSLDVALAAQHAYRFRVRAIDRAGNVGDWTAGPGFSLSSFTESSTRIAYKGAWTKVSSSLFWGGSARKATATGATATIKVTGRSIAWIGLRGPGRGKATIYVDGTKVATVDLYASTYQGQRVIWARDWPTSGTRTVMIRVAGTSGRPRIDLDGMIVGT